MSTKPLADIITELGPCSEINVYDGSGDPEHGKAEREKLKAAGISGNWKTLKNEVKE